jgi:Holliday junction resolvase
MKRKGINAERELLHMFWQAGFVAMRAPSSGAIKYPCPDLLVGNTLRKLAIECKSTKSIKQYISNQQISKLKEFSKIFGAEPWIGVRFDRLDWYFLSLEDIKETNGNNFVIGLELAKQKGLLFEELIGKFQ